MLGKLVRGRLDAIVVPLARALARSGLTANMLTVAALPVVAASAWLVASGRLFLGGWVHVAGSLFDLLDGAVAKVTGTKSRWGGFIDSTTDRLADGLMLGAIAWHLAWGTGSRLGVLLALSALVLGYLTSYIRARAEGLGFTCEVGVAERPERVVIVGAALVFGIVVPALALLTVLSLITVVQRLVHVHRQARQATPT